MKSKHLFHIVKRSPWPFLTSLSGLFFLSGLVFYMHKIFLGGLLFLLGFTMLLVCAYSWFKDIIMEATYEGYHTLVVRSGLKKGFILFIVSEIMLFFGFFWAFFHSSLSPSVELGLIWPPHFLNTIHYSNYPLFNTLLLIVSGFSVTWVHRGMAIGAIVEVFKSFFVTIFLGIFFICFQGLEYYQAPFNISDGIYASSFYMLTGLHGCHVIVGIIFLCVNFFRVMRNHFLTTHYLGLVFAIWYWHFVDIVWILLFLSVYCWGNW